MRIQKDNKAVSPVIGIMLMLVVTVILAAAVSSSSSGLMKSSEKAPFAVFDVKVAKDVPDGYGAAVSYLAVKQITGDAIQTKDLKIVTTNAAGQLKEKVSSDVRTYTYYDEATAATTCAGNAPFWNNVGIGGWPSIAADYGNYTLKPGVSMTAQQYTHYYDPVNSTPIALTTYPTWNASTSKYEGAGTHIGQMQDMFAGWDLVKKGDIVNVKLIHTPSNKVIFASDVEVI